MPPTAAPMATMTAGPTAATARSPAKGVLAWARRNKTIVGGTCTGITVSNVELNGVPLDPTTTYSVTVNNFLVDGGDNFVTFREVDPALRVGGGIDLDELVNYLGSEGPIAPPGTDRANELP